MVHFSMSIKKRIFAISYFELIGLQTAFVMITKQMHFGASTKTCDLDLLFFAVLRHSPLECFMHFAFAFFTLEGKFTVKKSLPTDVTTYPASVC